MSKTPYEIRLETLHLAYSIISDKKRSEAMHKYTDPMYAEAPSTTEIFQEALVLRQFIDNEGIGTVITKMEDSDERRVFFVDLGDLVPSKANEILKHIQKTLEEKASAIITSEDARIAVEGAIIPDPEPVVAEFPEEQTRAEFLEQLKSDGSACCGGTDESCECNPVDTNAGC